MEPNPLVGAVLARMRREGHGCALITEGSRLVGIFTERDALLKVIDRPETWTGPIDTVTLYLGPARSEPLIEEIIDAKPRRIIMNPGAENAALAEKAEDAGIEVVEGCTLVMLRTGQF